MIFFGYTDNKIFNIEMFRFFFFTRAGALISDILVTLLHTLQPAGGSNELNVLGFFFCVSK